MTEIDLTGEGIYGEIVGHGFYLEGEEARRKTLAVDVALIGDAPPTLYQLTDFLWGELKEPLQDCRFDYCIRDRCYKRFPKG